MLRHRATAVLISLAVVIQLALTWMHLPGWECPALAGLGQPCPGCGLSRASLAMFAFDFDHMWSLHAFAPLSAVVVLLFAAAAVLPRGGVSVLADRVEHLER